MHQTILDVRQITKRFSSVQALAEVSLTLQRGEVHAVVGENGAGKSTLMQILAGVQQPDSGRILLDGRPVVFRDRRSAEQQGISIVFQELSLVPNLSVAENIFAGRQPTNALGFICWAELYRRAAELLAPFGVPISPHERVDGLALANQQIVEIAKALSVDTRIVILDEPTSSLDQHEVGRLFGVIRHLTAQGMSVLYISHHLKEVLEIADRVSVLRDGHLIGTLAAAELDPQKLIGMMVGHAVSDLYVRQERAGHRPEVALSVRALTRRGSFTGLDFDLHCGEILGLTGLIGAGCGVVGATLFGSLRAHAGQVEVFGARRQIRHPADAIGLGISYLPPDRKRQGLFLTMNVWKNIVAGALSEFSWFGLLDDRRMQRTATEQVARMHVQAAGIDQPIVNLSGGNQQKVLLALALMTEPRILIVDEPTRGIDVAAKAQIHALLRQLALSGVAILLISSDLPEVLSLADRVLVMHKGQVSGILDGAGPSEEQVLTLASGSAALERQL